MLTLEERDHQLWETINGTYSPWSISRRQRPRRQSRIIIKNLALPQLPEITADDKKRKTRGRLVCSICGERPVTVFIAPCGHAKICLVCMHQMQRVCTTNRLRCAMCRTPVGSVHRLYT